MKFANASILFLLIFLPPLLYLLLHLFKFRWKRLGEFAGDKSLRRMGFNFNRSMDYLRAALILLSFTCCIIALARPQWGYEDRRIVSHGVDVIVAVDASLSMLAQDYKPNRLTRAKELLQNIIYEVKGDRVGVIAYAGTPVILCPLTLDYRMAETALQTVNPGIVEKQGTDIGAAIELANNAFEISNAGEKILILLTDGEDQGQVLNRAINDAKQAGIKIFTIGIGTTEGANIPQAGGYKRDNSGNIVNTVLNFDTLEEIAKSTGGEAIKAQESGIAELHPIMHILQNTKGEKKQDSVYRVYKDRFIWFLIPAVLLLLIESLVPSSIRRNQGIKIVPVLLLGSLLFYPANGFSWPGEAQIISREANQNFALNEYDKAKELYKRAHEVSPDNPVTVYNLATANAMLGESDNARNNFLSVFEPNNNKLNSQALYNASTILHKTVRQKIDSRWESWEQTKTGVTDPQETLKELDSIINDLKKVIDEYKQAILKNAEDQDIKYNYEIAKDDLKKLEDLKKELESQQNPNEQQEQQKQENNDQNNQENQQNSQQNGGNQNESGSDSSEQDKPSETNKNEQPESDPSKDNSPPQQPSDQSKEDPAPNESPGVKPTPTPTPTPSPSPSPNQGDTSQQQMDSSDTGQPAPTGEMSKADVERLFNTLPPEDAKAVQRMFYTPQRENPMEKDW